MDTSEISDKRDLTAFRKITFSKFQKSKAKEELIKSLYNSKLENACYWSAEFICSGHFLELWDIFITYFCKYIHIGNPKMVLYLEMRYNNFIKIINNGYNDNILLLRNNAKIRQLFSEIVCVMALSNKKHIYKEIKIDKNTQYDLLELTDKFKAPSINYVQKIYLENDPKELFIPINELIYNLESDNIVETCYWYEWILNYEIILKKKKIKCKAEGRSYAPKDYYHDIIWIIWDIIYYYVNLKKNNIMSKIIDSLFKLFCIKFNPSFKRKRKNIIYFAFTILIEKVNLNENIIKEHEIISKFSSNIDLIYKQIKKNEESLRTDYLFHNLNKSNIEKTIEKIDILDNM
jgi:hypothetical protein